MSEEVQDIAIPSEMDSAALSAFVEKVRMTFDDDG